MAQPEAKPKVVRLYSDPPSVEVLEELTELLRDGKLDSLVIMGHKPYDEAERKEKGTLGTIFRYWFAQDGMGSLNLLGLLDYARGLIRKYVIEGIDLVRDDE